MQILEIVLYSYKGQKRTVYLKQGKLNIITGASKTGKSALIDIVEYCLGKSDCTVAEGIIRKTVEWYGLRLQFPTEQVFIARKNPPPGQRSTSEVYLEQGEVVESPASPPSRANTNVDALIDSLSSRLGISPNESRPDEGETRRALSANIKHSLFYCFQQQDEIASKKILIHRQNEPFMLQAIRDTLPYFLGAIKEDDLALKQELTLTKRELARAERALFDAEAIKGDNVGQAHVLLSELQEVGVIPNDVSITKPEEFRELFTNYRSWSPQQRSYPGSSRIPELQAEIKKLRELITHKTHDLQAAESFAEEAKGYKDELYHQQKRLESIHIFEKTDENVEICPLCKQDLSMPVLKAEAIKKALDAISENLNTSNRDEPHLRNYINSLKEEISELRHKISGDSDVITSLLRNQADAERDQDLIARQLRTVGRMTLWLDNVQLVDSTSPLKEEVKRLQEKVSKLEKKLDPGLVKEALDSIFSEVGAKMTNWAKKLELEHCDHPVRYIEEHVTVAVIKKDDFISLNKMGSGENWLGYHLVTILAFHDYFARHNRPVPRFLFLDQPSQVYYPPEKDEELEGAVNSLDSEDKRAIRRIYDLVLDVIADLEPQFQVIITDHADLNEKRFRKHIVERWRDGTALIPQEWQNT